jgi:hypothetical protein
VASQRNQHRDRVVEGHAEDERRCVGSRGREARGVLQARRCRKHTIVRGDADALGDPPEAGGERLAVAVVAIEHDRPLAAEHVVQVVGGRIADLAGAEHRAEARGAIRDSVAVGGGDERDEPGIGVDRSGRERSAGEVRPHHDERVAGCDLARRPACAVVGAAIVVNRELDAGQHAFGIGLVDREADGVGERASGELTGTGERRRQRDRHGLRLRLQRRRDSEHGRQHHQPGERATSLSSAPSASEGMAHAAHSRHHRE